MSVPRTPWLRALVILAFALVLVAVVRLREAGPTATPVPAVPAPAAAEAPKPGPSTAWVELGSAPEADAAKIQAALTAESIATRASAARPGTRTLSVPTRDAARARALANEESVLQGLSFTPPSKPEGGTTSVASPDGPKTN